jgi:hypothetical protein
VLLPSVDVSALFARLRDREFTTHAVASLAVPELADACIVDVVEPHGVLRSREVAASTAELTQRIEAIREFSPDPRTRSRSVPGKRSSSRP